MNNRKLRFLSFFLILSLVLSSTVYTVNSNAKVIYRRKVIIRFKKPKKAKKAKKKIYLDFKKISLHKGDYEWLELKNASNKVKWSSSKPSVASVKKDGNWGKIKAKKKGTAIIKAKYKGHTYKCKVTVKKRKKTAFEIIGYGKNLDLLIIGDDPILDKQDVLIYSPLRSITLYYYIENPEYISCEWGSWNEDTAHLYVKPKVKANVSTYIIITNSYNNQKEKIKVTITYLE